MSKHLYIVHMMYIYMFQTLIYKAVTIGISLVMYRREIFGECNTTNKLLNLS